MTDKLKQPTPEFMARLKSRMAAVRSDIIREDGRLERHCKHGIGHTVGHLRGYLRGGWETVHGCDGCCSAYEMQEVRDDRGKLDGVEVPEVPVDPNKDWEGG